MAETTGPSEDRLTEVRRQLVNNHIDWERQAKELYDKKDYRGWDAATMAGSFAYTLGAVLGFLANERGERELATLLAEIADDILTNGDDGELNADLYAEEKAKYEAIDKERADAHVQ